MMANCQLENINKEINVEKKMKNNVKINKDFIITAAE